VVLDAPPTGFSIAQAGPAVNGSINAHEYAVLSGAEDKESEFQHLFDQGVRAYARTWVKAPSDVLVVFVLETPAGDIASQLIAGAREASDAAGWARFPTDGLMDSVGYRIHAEDSKLDGQSVFLRRGRWAAFVLIGGAAPTHYTPSDALALARRQAERLPGDPGTTEGDGGSLPYQVGRVVAMALLPAAVVVLVVVAVRLRSPTTVAEPPVGWWWDASAGEWRAPGHGRVN
jgi:hypothetical protein